MIEPSLYQQEG